MEEAKTDIAPAEKTQKQQDQEAMLAKLEAATEKLEKANKRYERNRAMEEAAKVDKMLDGNGEAGIEEKKKGITDQEYAQKVLHGEMP